MFLGSKIYDARKKMQLTQKELADGICSQATISKLESSNEPPDVLVLAQLCLRVNLTVNDVLSEFDQQNTMPQKAKKLSQQLSKVEHLFFVNEPLKTIDILSTLNESDLQIDQDLLAEFNFDWGNYYLLGKNQFDDALFYFNKVLTITSMATDSLFTILAYNSLGVCYAAQEDTQKAEYYFNLSLDHVRSFCREHSDLSSESIGKIVRIFNNISIFYSRQREFTRSNELINEAIGIVTQYHSFPPLEDFYYNIAFNSYDSGSNQHELMISNLNTAEVLAANNQNKVVLDHITKLRKDIADGKTS